MSHYSRIKTCIREAPILITALHEMGFEKVEHLVAAQPLFGYQGDQRLETAEVIIRRQDIGRVSNDVGFKLEGSGEYQAVISEYDGRTRFNSGWLQELNRRYSYHVVYEQAREQNLIVEEDYVTAAGERVLILSERA